MRWVDAMQAALDFWQADMVLLGALGGYHIYRHGEHNEYLNPAVYWMVFSDLTQENTNPIQGQLDIYAPDLDTAVLIEGALRSIHHDTPREVSGLLMLAQITDARDHAEGIRAESGIVGVHRSLDFRIEVARELS